VTTAAEIAMEMATQQKATDPEKATALRREALDWMERFLALAQEGIENGDPGDHRVFDSNYRTQSIRST